MKNHKDSKAKTKKNPQTMTNCYDPSAADFCYQHMQLHGLFALSLRGAAATKQSQGGIAALPSVARNDRIGGSPIHIYAIFQTPVFL
jgi:hypothetical protein